MSLKRVLLSSIKETFVEKVKLDVLDASGKMRLKIEHFLLKIVFNKSSFCQELTTLGFRRRMISVKLFAFGVNILLDTDTNTKILMIAELRN